ncbi:formamidopyrimidine-DNA glycosylase [Striga asiatica]|uniref:Formamidopyrimidine-DNA glycosylase n=1 Tax=Striga asiatica TaxID=4170 RepID=A0A5A7R8V9_STRAF|nr:formamidopyrimidine-DNA glycosylase [Striga asiatica]
MKKNVQSRKQAVERIERMMPHWIAAAEKIKALLLNQSFMSGIGNWMADEEVIEKSIEVGPDSSQFLGNWIFYSRGKKPDKVFVNGKKIDFINAGRKSAWSRRIGRMTMAEHGPSEFSIVASLGHTAQFSKNHCHVELCLLVEETLVPELGVDVVLTPITARRVANFVMSSQTRTSGVFFECGLQLRFTPSGDDYVINCVGHRPQTQIVVAANPVSHVVAAGPLQQYPDSVRPAAAGASMSRRLAGRPAVARDYMSTTISWLDPPLPELPREATTEAVGAVVTTTEPTDGGGWNW